MKSRQRINRIIFVPLITVLVLILATLCVMAFVLDYDRGDVPVPDVTGRPSTENAFGHQATAVAYNGKDYYYNNHLTTYLFMGVDNDGPVEVHEGAGMGGGRSDAMFLLVTNDEDQSLSIISINRNSISDVEVFSADGISLGKYALQICLQHAYGDGGAVSCERSVEAVSHLFYDLPISGYISLNMGGIPGINDAVGGVSVDILQDISDKDRKIKLKKGDTVSLTGEQAYVYIRSRELDEFDSATDRLRRQEQYMAAFIQRLRETAAGNPSVAASIYMAMTDYAVTDMNVEETIMNFVNYSYDPQNMYTVPGETVQGDSLEEYHVDDDALYELVLSVFYEAE